MRWLIINLALYEEGWILILVLRNAGEHRYFAWNLLEFKSMSNNFEHEAVHWKFIPETSWYEKVVKIDVIIEIGPFIRQCVLNVTSWFPKVCWESI